MARVIFHIDLNSFFASAEILLDPSLQGKPIAVSGHSRRAVISTASYEARAFGVNSAMPNAMALQLCPELIIVNGHHEYYEKLSNQFIEIIHKYTDVVEKASIDECYADMTEIIKNFKKPLDLAWQIQKELLHDLGLKCSIGVAPNKFLAKMASDMKKPMGITVLRIQEVPKKLWPLPIELMRGIGKKTSPTLREIGILTIGDLANSLDITKLRKILGKNTESMINRANGYDDSEIICEWDVKSMSQSTTLNSDLTEYDEIKEIFNELSTSLSRRLMAEDKMGNLLTITIKYYDFNVNTRSKKFSFNLCKQEDLFQNALDLFDENTEDKPIRLLGIGVGNLRNMQESQTQLSLFENKMETSETEKIIDELNKKLRVKKIKKASSLLKKKGRT